MTVRLIAAWRIYVIVASSTPDCLLLVAHSVLTLCYNAIDHVTILWMIMKIDNSIESVNEWYTPSIILPITIAWVKSALR